MALSSEYAAGHAVLRSRRPSAELAPGQVPSRSVRIPMLRITARLVCLGLAVAPFVRPDPSFAWGGTGHRVIASRYSASLPGPMNGLALNDAWVVDHVMDPDARKSTVPSERYRHYIDIDAYPEYHAGTLSHDRAVLEAAYGAAQVEQWGIVPWAIGEVVDSMTAAMERADWTRVRFWTADLCHYVGDLHQPLHCTLNYDGQLTGNNGIHYRYESRMLDLNSGALVLPAGAYTYYPSPVDAAFEFAGQSQIRVAEVIDADNAAKAVSGGSVTSPAYYSELWNRTRQLTLTRLTQAAVVTASFVYTAWVNAGHPVIPGSTVGVDPADPGADGGRREMLELSASPSPTTGQVTVQYLLPAAGAVTLEAYDVTGKRIATLLDGEQAAGPGSVSWNLRNGAAPVPAGQYFLRLTQSGRIAHARVTLAP